MTISWKNGPHKVAYTKTRPPPPHTHTLRCIIHVATHPAFMLSSVKVQHWQHMSKDAAHHTTLVTRLCVTMTTSVTNTRPSPSRRHTAFYPGSQTGVLCVSVGADASAETSRSLSGPPVYLFIFFPQSLFPDKWCRVFVRPPERACACCRAGRQQLRTRTVFVEEQHGCREEWGDPEGGLMVPLLPAQR